MKFETSSPAPLLSQRHNLISRSIDHLMNESCSRSHRIPASLSRLNQPAYTSPTHVFERRKNIIKYTVDASSNWKPGPYRFQVISTKVNSPFFWITLREHFKQGVKWTRNRFTSHAYSPSDVVCNVNQAGMFWLWYKRHVSRENDYI